jgi:Tol biopolymer transport system component
LYFEGSFSPDGRWLAVASNNRQGVWEITVYEVATGRAVPTGTSRARAGPFLEPAWAPDGEWLFWPDFPGINGFRPSDGTLASIDTDGGAYQGVAVLSDRETAAG